MGGFALRSRQPRGVGGSIVVSDADVIAAHLEDAAHFAGGHASELFVPESESQIAEVVRRARTVLPIGAQSSLTGGATPMGDVLISTRRLNRILSIEPNLVRVQAGVTLSDLDLALARAGRYYPPAPTFTGAFIGGTVATNAAGAATFKYGPTRPWVQALTAILANGDVLDVERGTTHAHPDGYFELELSTGRVRVPVPTYRMPSVPKLSAGYFAAPEMDLIDLFIGSEGTLGIITEVTLRVVPIRPAFCQLFVTFADERTALTVVRRLREASVATWSGRGSRGIDVSAIEYMDKRSLALLREDGVDRHSGVKIEEDAKTALLFTLELPPDMTADRAYEEIGISDIADAPDTPLVRLCHVLRAFDVIDRSIIAAPGDRARAHQLSTIREAVPAAVNQRVGRAKQHVDPRIDKTAADVIVPFDRIEMLLAFCQREFDRRGLDGAIWGHVSDGNVHPNIIPRSFEDVESGREVVGAIGREAIRLGGAPLAEHGVGRNQTKQKLLIDLYGAAGIDQMRRLKSALDPTGKLSPGVIFARG